MPVIELQLLALAAMAVLTYVTRVGGVLLMQFTRPQPRLESLLRHLSGSVMAALCGPALLYGDVPLRIAVAAAVVTMLLFRNMLAALFVSVAVTGVMRAYA